MSPTADFPFQKMFGDMFLPKKHHCYHPWEPTTFIFRGYNPYVRPLYFMVLGSKTPWMLHQSSAFPPTDRPPPPPPVGTSSTDLRRSPAAPACSRAAVEPEKLARRGPAEVLLGAIVATAEPLVLGPFALKLKCLEVPPGAKNQGSINQGSEGGDVTSIRDPNS